MPGHTKDTITSLLFIAVAAFSFSFSEELFPSVEVFFHDDTDTLCVESIACEVSFVGLVIDFDGNVAIVCKQVPDVEVADECGGSVRIVAVAKLSVDGEAVVE